MYNRIVLIIMLLQTNLLPEVWLHPPRYQWEAPHITKACREFTVKMSSSTACLTTWCIKSWLVQVNKRILAQLRLQIKPRQHSFIRDRVVMTIIINTHEDPDMKPGRVGKKGGGNHPGEGTHLSQIMIRFLTKWLWLNPQIWVQES